VTIFNDVTDRLLGVLTHAPRVRSLLDFEKVAFQPDLPCPHLDENRAQGLISPPPLHCLASRDPLERLDTSHSWLAFWPLRDRVFADISTSVSVIT
jgi:hypothetical protein